MVATGIDLTLRLGQSGSQPAPRQLLEALQSVEVTHSDEGRSGFQIVFQAGRSGVGNRQDYPLFNSPLLKPGNRAILSVTIVAKSQVLMDGIITHQQLSPGQQVGQSTLTVTGEDVSVMMDIKEGPVEYPAQDAKGIVEQILKNYSQYGIEAQVKKPPENAPSTREHIPVKRGTDLQYIQLLAQRFAYVFYVTPGRQAGKNIAYWGPPKDPGKRQPQRAISVNMGAYTNAESLNFQFNALAATQVTAEVQDSKTNKVQPVQIQQSQRPSLSQRPALQDSPLVRTSYFQSTGQTYQQARDRAQSLTDRAADKSVTVTGELDTVRYGALLQIRQLVGLRGAGNRYDGLYYVKRVSHRLRPGEYKQSFTLTREGVGTTVNTLPTR